VHAPAAASVPPENVMDPAPATGAYVGAPHPLVAAPVGLATTIVPGKVSEKATPLNASFWFGFVMVKVSVETPPGRIGFGANSFVMLGGRTAVSEAAAEPVELVFVPLSVALTYPLTFS
jgi:hypothetical protein